MEELRINKKHILGDTIILRDGNYIVLDLATFVDHYGYRIVRGYMYFDKNKVKYTNLDLSYSNNVFSLRSLMRYNRKRNARCLLTETFAKS